MLPNHPTRIDFWLPFLCVVPVICEGIVPDAMDLRLEAIDPADLHRHFANIEYRSTTNDIAPPQWIR